MPVLYDNLVRGASAQDYPAVQSVLLTYGERQRNRLALMLPSGQAAAIVLPRGQFMQAGDILLSADCRALLIQASAERLVKASANTRLGLLRLVYHLANRHVRAMIEENAVFIEPDPVLEQMIVQLGGRVEEVELPFEPEAGAYAGGHHHHGHDDPSDRVMGSVGEMLSIAAHKARGGDAS